jgi:hypothetical protein
MTRRDARCATTRSSHSFRLPMCPVKDASPRLMIHDYTRRKWHHGTWFHASHHQRESALYTRAPCRKHNTGSYSKCELPTWASTIANRAGLHMSNNRTANLCSLHLSENRQRKPLVSRWKYLQEHIDTELPHALRLFASLCVPVEWTVKHSDDTELRFETTLRGASVFQPQIRRSLGVRDLCLKGPRVILGRVVWGLRKVDTQCYRWLAKFCWKTSPQHLTSKMEVLRSSETGTTYKTSSLREGGDAFYGNVNNT